MSDGQHQYEKIQDFNCITRTLHQTRYSNLQKLTSDVHKELPGKLRVLDIGSGPAKAYDIIRRLPIDFEYVGVELNEDFCKIAESRYGSFDDFKIIHDSIENQFDLFNNADLIIGLESFEHIPEWLVTRVIEHIGCSSFKYLYVTVPNEIGLAILVKNIGSFLMGYFRHKEYSWRETFYASIYQLDKVQKHAVGHIGFDWRWLAQVLRQNTNIVEKVTSPFNLLPKFISPSIGFVCKNIKIG